MGSPQRAESNRRGHPREMGDQLPRRRPFRLQPRPWTRWPSRHPRRPHWPPCGQRSPGCGPARAEILIALINAGIEGRGSVHVECPDAGAVSKRAVTVVQLREKKCGESFEAPHIEQAVSSPQHPTITGWVMRRKWGARYTGLVAPWMYPRRYGWGDGVECA